METVILKQSDPQWADMAQRIQAVSWRAGAHLAQRMHTSTFDWEQVIVLMHHQQLVGFCALLETDIVPATQSPFISYVFVDEAYRGQGLSTRLVQAAEQVALEIGFDVTYIVTRHVGLYERLGYELFDHRLDQFGRENRLLMKRIHRI